MDETTITKECCLCSRIVGGKEEDFRGWLNYKYKPHKTSTEEKE